MRELKKGPVTYTWGAKSSPPTGLPFDDCLKAPTSSTAPSLPPLQLTPLQLTLLTVGGGTRAQPPDWTAWVQTQFHLLLIVGPWKIRLAVLCLRFLVYKMRVNRAPICKAAVSMRGSNLSAHNIM